MPDLTIVPSRDRFEELAKLGNVVPVFVDLVADDQTPSKLSSRAAILSSGLARG